MLKVKHQVFGLQLMGCIGSKLFKREALLDKPPLDEAPLSEYLISLHRHEAKYEINEDGSVTFWPTPDCETSTERLQTIKMTELMAGVAERANCARLEMTSDSDLDVIDCTTRFNPFHWFNPICSFIKASFDSWSNHYPIRFKPEHIWLLILQGVAVHVDQNAEKLRAKYVNHKEKMTLRVQRDDFVLGSAGNDWEGVIEEFVEQIDANTVKDTAALFDCDFSRSTAMDKICTKVAIMDICKHYFRYEFSTMCGFPKITLDGNRADWVRLKEKTSVLLRDKVDEQFGAHWGRALLPLLDRFIGAFDGEIDCLFWNSMIKRRARGGSAGSDYQWFSGWINILFPFTNKGTRNIFCVPYSMRREYMRQGLALKRNEVVKSHEYPTGLAQAPVTWNYLGQELKLQFIAGFIGYQQDPETLEICPNLAWCIAHCDDNTDANDDDSK